MSVSPNHLKIVVIDNPSDVWNEPLCRELFPEIIALKFKGYGAEYPHGVIAVDATDWVSTHIAVCREQDGRLAPLVAYRTIDLPRCDHYKLPFPGLSLARSSNATSHVEYLEKLIAQNAGKKLRYCSSYTIDPSVRQDRELTSLIKQVLCSIQVNFLKDDQTDLSMLAGVVKFKVDQMFGSWGYVPVGEPGNPLPSIFQTSLNGTEVRMMSLPHGFTDIPKQLGIKYRSLWENRLVVTPERADEKIAA